MSRTYQINLELLSQNPTHVFENQLVKVFQSTISRDLQMATAEIMDGPDKGKWTTVYLDKAVAISSLS